jgi:putative flippase GtrA
VRDLRDYLFVRHRHNWVLLLRFGLVGASGVLVNMLTLIVVKKLGPHFDEAIVGIPATQFNIRWYHVYSTVAFLVANLWNFQLNRRWTFRSAGHARWWTEYWPFLAVGLLGQLIGLGLLTLLMHPDSALALPATVFDDSTGLRTRLYWAQLIVIGVVTPLSFVLNKLWTFAAVRTLRRPADATRPR